MPKCAGCSTGGPTGPTGPTGATGPTGPGGGGGAAPIYYGFEFDGNDFDGIGFTHELRTASFTVPGDFSFNSSTEMVIGPLNLAPGDAFTIFGFLTTAFTPPAFPYQTFVDWHVMVGNAAHTQHLVADAQSLNYPSGFTPAPIYTDWTVQTIGSDLTLDPGPFGRPVVTSAAGGIFWGTLHVVGGASAST